MSTNALETLREPVRAPKPIRVLINAGATAAFYDIEDDEVRKKVLVIGIDGCRPDALAQAATPHLDSLIAGGIYADNTQILGDRYLENNTITAPRKLSSPKPRIRVISRGVSGSKITC